MARKKAAPPRSERKGKDSGKKFKKKVCVFCKEGVEWIDYKDVNLLRRFMSDRGKIRARRVSGNCAQHQREVAVAIKTARELALLPYTQRTVTERGPGRGTRGDPDSDRPPRVAEADGDVGEDLADELDLGHETEDAELEDVLEVVMAGEVE